MISRHNLPDERARPVAHVTCSIFGDHVEPGVWTKYFAIEPDISVVKGKPFNTPSGRISSHPGRTGVWGCSSRLAIQDKTLDAHISFLTLLCPGKIYQDCLKKMTLRWKSCVSGRTTRVTEHPRSTPSLCI